MNKNRDVSLSVSITEKQVDVIVVQSLMQAVNDALVNVCRAEDFSVILSMLVVIEYYSDADTWQMYSKITIPDVKAAMAQYGVDFS